MALRRLFGLVLALAVTQMVGCCWCRWHHHHCCYVPPAPGPVVVPACGPR